MARQQYNYQSGGYGQSTPYENQQGYSSYGIPPTTHHHHIHH